MDKDKEARKKFPKTVPVDARFPNSNQTWHCYSSYVDFYKCTQLLGEEHEPCNFFKHVFTVLCPNAWIAKWDQQREDGVFPVTLPNDAKREQQS